VGEGKRIFPAHHLFQSATLLGGDVLSPSGEAKMRREAQLEDGLLGDGGVQKELLQGEII